MMIGKRISGRYKVLEMIGGGGMANVYLAHDMILDRDVAVKVLRHDFSNDEEFIRRFYREAQSATSLAHPNIVNIYDVGEEDSTYYIVMEYVEGQTLKQYIQQNSPVKVETALDILQQLTSAIAHAHQNQIIHRDIKPQNILIDKNGTVKITDFGIAMAMSATSITQTNSVIGSIHYLSPEQARGGVATEKSDIYSLGIVMFELLTGRLPFSGESAISIALKHLQSETPSVRNWNREVPQSVENIVLKATAKDPAYRYASAEEMEEDIKTALDPSRINEEKFVIPKDLEETKIMPVIAKEPEYGKLDETIVHKNGGNGRIKPDKEKKKKTKSNKKKRKWPVILISVFLILVVFFVGAVTLLPDLLAPDEVEVPDLTGMTVEEAEEELENAGLVVGDKIEIHDEEMEEGLVIKTNPRKEKIVKEGTEVDLYVSLGKEKFELGDYTGRLYEDVFQLLSRENFKDIIRNDVYHDEIPAGTIIEQSPEAGEEVIPDETVLEFTVSKGPEVFQLKDLTGYNEKGLEEYAASTGLTIEIAGEDHHDSIEKGLVMSQDPKSGTNVKRGDKIKVVLSKGKKEIPPKSVRREVTVPYEPVVEGMPQIVQIFIEDMNHSMTEAAQTFEITEPVVITIELIIPHGGKGGYKVQLDDRVIADETVPYPG